MRKDIESRIRRLERKHRASGGVDAITEALRNRTEEDIISLLVGSELFPRLDLLTAKRIAKEILSDTSN